MVVSESSDGEIQVSQLTMEFDKAERLRFAEITDETRRRLREFWPILQPNLPKILDGFYEHATSVPQLAKLLDGQVPRLKQAQSVHWQRLFQGDFDDDYFQSAQRVGVAHGKIGLELRWYIAGYSFVLDWMVLVACNGLRWSKKRRHDTIRAVNAAVLFDMELAMSAYQDTMARARVAQADMIVNHIGKGLEALAKGDLTNRITADLEGPFRKLRDDFNEAGARLEEAVKAVLAGTSGIGTDTAEIATAADDLSRRTEQQAASLEETAAALEEITATVKRTAENAKEAGAIVTSAKTAAEDGGRIVESAVEAMSQIEQSSKKITDIIGVIDEIAFQTNLLALNAGVEAARAGDAGKGFAVVASEVRALAQRSGEAAKEIKALIKTSGEHVGTGVRQVGESGKALKTIVEKVTSINALVSEMAEAARQQSTGIEEVNVAVGQMDQVTQQNAAMVEQSTAAARSLADETAELSRLVGFFQVHESAGGKPAVRKVEPRAATTKAPLRAASPAISRGNAALAVKPVAVEDDWQEF